MQIEPSGRTLSVGIRVFVIDGQADSRWAASLALMAEPAMEMVELVGPGPEAIRRAARHRPDLVLLDVGGSCVAGLDLLRRLKARPAAPRVVLIAEMVPAGLRAAMLEAGADGVVTRLGFTLQLLELVDRFFPPVDSVEAIARRKMRGIPVKTCGLDPIGRGSVHFRRVPRGERAVN